VTLEVGCGAAPNRNAINGEYLGIDIIGTDYADGVPRRMNLIADASYLPFKPHVFDLVFYVAVCYYLREIIGPLHEAKRVLNSNGCLLIFEYSPPTVRYVGSRENVPVYPRDCSSWTTLVQHVGFSHVKVVFKSLSWRVRLLHILLPKQIAWRWLDNRKAPILISARKPN
jgi:SAM-dependent methyltransferase